MAEELESSVAQGAYGGQPYGDRTEVTGPPEVVVIPAPYREFLATDARSAVIVLQPNHYNFIPNPSFRTDSNGWSMTAVGGGSLPVVLDPEDYWVGQSVLVDGDAALRYKGKDSADADAFVYTGPALPSEEQPWYEPGRESPEWTFSCYVKGTGRIRLTMSAYYPQVFGEVKSPPQFPANLAQMAPGSPMTSWPYGGTAVLDENGQVWTRKDPPFYNMLAKPAVASSSPATITTKMLMPPVVVDPAHDVWEVKTTYPPTEVPPLYTRWGTPATAADPSRADPATYAPNEKYIQDADHNLWVAKSPKPLAPLDEGGQPVVPPPPYWYYSPILPPTVQDPATEQPDRSRFDKYLMYGADLWVLKDPIPASAPYYQFLATPAVHTDTDPSTADDPDKIPPDPAKPYLIVSHATDKDKNGAVWKLTTQGYYEPTDQYPWFAKVYGNWVDVQPGTDWQRVLLQTAARLKEDKDRISFIGAYWIDALIEVEGGVGLRISSVMLDPNEHPIAEYFDGGMAEDPRVDDYIWEGAADDSISNYYYDRRIRTRWLWENLKWVTPVGRPQQIYFRTMENAYVPPSEAVQSLSRMDDFSL